MQHSDIIEKVRRGDIRPVKRLYDYYPVVKKWLIAHGCDRDRTMDIYQEALVVFCDRCQDPEFRLTATVDTYLFAVSRNIHLSQARKDSASSTMDLDSVEEIAADDHMAWKEKEQKLSYAFRALELLADKCRTILQLFYLQQKSMKEIADKMGFRSVQAAKNRKFKCLKFAKEKAMNLLKEQ